MPRALLLVGVTGVWLARGVAVAEPCTPALGEAAAEYRVRAQAEEDRIRHSTPEAPRGVQQVAQFDLAAHACHQGPGQAYKVLGVPVCTEVGPDAATVRYPYELYFRRALNLTELYRAAWEEGSEGILQVQFRREGERWIPVAREGNPDFPGVQRPPTGDSPGR